MHEIEFHIIYNDFHFDLISNDLVLTIFHLRKIIHHIMENES